MKKLPPADADNYAHAFVAAQVGKNDADVAAAKWAWENDRAAGRDGGEQHGEKPGVEKLLDHGTHSAAP